MEKQVLESSSFCSIESITSTFFDNHAISHKKTTLKTFCEFTGGFSDDDIVELRNIITTAIDAFVSGSYESVEFNYKQFRKKLPEHE